MRHHPRSSKSTSALGWPVELTCAGLALLIFLVVSQVSRLFPSLWAGSCTTLSGMCTPGQCSCKLPLRKRELVTQDAQACFQCVAEFCPDVAEGDQTCSTASCECEDPTWPQVDLQIDGQSCWQCVQPPVDVTIRTGADSQSCLADFSKLSNSSSVPARSSAAVLAATAPVELHSPLKGGRLVSSQNRSGCATFRYNGALITEKRHNQSCLSWHAFGEYWGLTDCNARDERMRFRQLLLAEGEAHGPVSYCSGKNASEFCVEVAENLCTEEKGRCSTEKCRCEDPSWVHQELRTVNGQPCFSCVPPMLQCTSSPEACTSGPCECQGIGHVKVEVTNQDNESACYRCEATASGGGSGFSMLATFAILVLAGSAGGYCLGRLFAENGTKAGGSKGRKAVPGCERTVSNDSHSWSAFVDWVLRNPTALRQWPSPSLRQLSRLADKALDWCDLALEPCYCVIDGVQDLVWDFVTVQHERLVAVVAWLCNGCATDHEDLAAKVGGASAEGGKSSKPVAKAKVAKAGHADAGGTQSQEGSYGARAAPQQKLQRPTLVGNENELTPAQKRVQRKLQQRRMAAMQQESATRTIVDPEPPTPLDESWIEELEQEEQKLKSASQKKASKAHRKRHGASSRDLPDEEAASAGLSVSEHIAVESLVCTPPNSELAEPEESDLHRLTKKESKSSKASRRKLQTGNTADEPSISGEIPVPMDIGIEAVRPEAEVGAGPPVKLDESSDEFGHLALELQTFEKASSAIIEDPVVFQPKATSDLWEEDVPDPIKKEDGFAERGPWGILPKFDAAPGAGACSTAGSTRSNSSLFAAPFFASETVIKALQSESKAPVVEYADSASQLGAREQRSLASSPRRAAELGSLELKCATMWADETSQATSTGVDFQTVSKDLQPSSDVCRRSGMSPRQGPETRSLESDGKGIESERRTLHTGRESEEVCSCGAFFFHGAVFCATCGTRRAEVCSCGSLFLQGAAYCASCGTKRSEVFDAMSPAYVESSFTAPAPEFASQAVARQSLPVDVPRARRRKGKSRQLAADVLGTSPGDMGMAPTMMPEPVLPFGEAITTVMMSGLPLSYTPESLRTQLDQLGLEGTYDFFFMPVDKKTALHMGYAFINFIDTSFAILCYWLLWQWQFTGSITAAEIQGLESNLAHWWDSATAKEFASVPVVISNPQPTAWAVNTVNSILSQHSREEFHKTKLCVFHEKSHCEMGAHCPFAHSPAELVPAPDLAKTKVCYSFFCGRCIDPHCKFAHGFQELRAASAAMGGTCFWPPEHMQWQYGATVEADDVPTMDAEEGDQDIGTSAAPSAAAAFGYPHLFAGGAVQTSPRSSQEDDSEAGNFAFSRMQSCLEDVMASPTRSNLLSTPTELGEVPMR